jgi:V/A-type H+/Na+-transporting ATPase subunit B
MRADVTATGTATRIEGPLVFLKRTLDVGLNAAVLVRDVDGRGRVGRVAAVSDSELVVEVLESTSGLGLADSSLTVLGESLTFAVGPGLLGRVFDSIGRPLDGGPPVAAVKRLRVDGGLINPATRALPRDFIETGVTTIDLMNSLVRGQKLPIFSGGGLPHDRLVTEIALRARLRAADAGRFAVVFAGIGISHDTAEAFRAALVGSGALARTAMFLNLADEPSSQRLLTPRYALTAAEYLAFAEGRHVLVVMTDMTNYCEALREVSASHGEVPSRKGYPGYMYSDLASIYERAGCIHGLAGTLTQLPVLTMPADDIGHPIPDLTGYITEGQIVLDRELDRRGIYPPIKVLPSLSRLMAAGTGRGYTDPNHPALANQLFAAYARAVRMRVLSSVMGVEGLGPVEQRFLAFGDRFEREVVAQAGHRTLDESMTAGWHALAGLPTEELTRLTPAQIATYVKGADSA